MKDLESLQKQERNTIYGCRIAIGIGILGIIFAPTPIGKVASGMLLSGGVSILNAPNEHDFINKFINEFFPPSK